ncbi:MULTISPECIES: hypothetical protein [unclassified Pseudomonas]|uniref:hypothetical protein n=1 Tax=unclassified Pseudomonas TaxID=196821 RepID=UPI000C2FB386|nr:MULTISPECIES: hypothetical protein [unclassified Pseudomonas]MCU1738075.1 hypothetical protein [Pseudomonas sp. 20S_6.2_Bac1]
MTIDIYQVSPLSMNALAPEVIAILQEDQSKAAGGHSIIDSWLALKAKAESYGYSANLSLPYDMVNLEISYTDPQGGPTPIYSTLFPGGCVQTIYDGLQIHHEISNRMDDQTNAVGGGIKLDARKKGIELLFRENPIHRKSRSLDLNKQTLDMLVSFDSAIEKYSGLDTYDDAGIFVRREAMKEINSDLAAIHAGTLNEKNIINIAKDHMLLIPELEGKPEQQILANLMNEALSKNNIYKSAIESQRDILLNGNPHNQAVAAYIQHAMEAAEIKSLSDWANKLTSIEEGKRRALSGGEFTQLVKLLDVSVRGTDIQRDVAFQVTKILAIQHGQSDDNLFSDPKLRDAYKLSLIEKQGTTSPQPENKSQPTPYSKPVVYPRIRG